MSSAPPMTSTPSTSSTAPTTSAAAAKTTAGAIKRMEDLLHALGRGDLKTLCVIAGPAMKKAEAEGVGSCEKAFTGMLSMISAKQKSALRTATVDPAKVATHGGKVEVPASAIRASVTFTEAELGDTVLEYQGDNWYVVD
ncbi:hypothetical protein EV186_101403 [Labedaea rhizosphaerae]|uniref:Nuclear transport factor 2 family protein n=2 Tax=Labedaea rhizosphaerae TaxID=598644 RepID=A0A4R6SKR7_LABRH|nr:hypothetical protein EV186_101403 [Labedaea rhizosphaerae]